MRRQDEEQRGRVARAAAGIGAAIAYNAVNPFAQTTRLIRGTEQTAELGSDGIPTNVHEKKLQETAKKRSRGEITPNTVISESAELPASKKKFSKPKMKKELFPDTEDMEVEAEAVQAVSKAASAPAATGKKGGIAKETPLSTFNPFLGIPDTANVILPWTSYLTWVTPADKTTVSLELRLTSPYDCLVSEIQAVTPSASIAGGRFNRKPPFDTVNGSWPAAPSEYPTQIGAGANTTEAPYYRGYYDKIYSQYACLGCEYKITFQNPVRNQANWDVVIAYGVDSFSNANAGRRFPNGTPAQMKYWPDLSWTQVKSTGDQTTDGCYTVIQGQYKTGTASRNVQNDEDLRTWTAVGSTPSLSEHLILRMGNSEFNQANAYIPIMVKIEMKFIVQYKDKKVQARYPVSGQTPFALNIPTDILTLV